MTNGLGKKKKLQLCVHHCVFPALVLPVQNISERMASVGGWLREGIFIALFPPGAGPIITSRVI